MYPILPIRDRRHQVTVGLALLLILATVAVATGIETAEMIGLTLGLGLLGQVQAASSEEEASSEGADEGEQRPESETRETMLTGSEQEQERRAQERAEWGDQWNDEWGWLGEAEYAKRRKRRQEARADQQPGSGDSERDDAPGDAEGAEVTEQGTGQAADPDEAKRKEGEGQDDQPEGQDDEPAIELGLDEEASRRFVEAFTEEIPTSVVTTPEEAIAYAGDLHKATLAYQQLEVISADNPAIPKMFNLMVDGKSFEEAVEEATEGRLVRTGPDRDEDPEAWMEEQIQREVNRRVEEKEEQLKEEHLGTRKERVASLKDQADAHYKRFAKEKELSPEQEDQFLDEYRVLFAGDPATGRLRPDMFHIIWRGLHHDRLVEEAIEEARVDGKNEGIEEARKEHMGRNNQPKPIRAAGGSGSPKELNPDQKRRAARKRRFARDGDFTDSLMGDWPMN